MLPYVFLDTEERSVPFPLTFPPFTFQMFISISLSLSLLISCVCFLISWFIVNLYKMIRLCVCVCVCVCDFLEFIFSSKIGLLKLHSPFGLRSCNNCCRFVSCYRHFLIINYIHIINYSWLCRRLHSLRYFHWSHMCHPQSAVFQRPFPTFNDIGSAFLFNERVVWNFPYHALV